MRLDDLLQRVRGARDIGLIDTERVSGREETPIETIEYDSRQVAKNSKGVLFACAEGDHTDGHLFAGDAVQKGAAGLICARKLPIDVPQILVRDVRSAMGLVAAELYGHPALDMTMIGLTGTNGKTTTSYMVRSIMRASGIKTGMLGTVVYDDTESEKYAERTTPEGPDTQRFLSLMVRNGASCCVMEASSHGLDQGRLKGCLFDRVGFGNLTSEHLEYHRDMENYFQAKRTLFTDYVKEDWRGVANANDEYGRRILCEFKDRVSGYTFEWDKEEFYSVRILENRLEGMRLEIIFPDGFSFEVASPLIGDYNALNILEAASVADSLGVEKEAIKAGIEKAPQVPGRLERYSFANGTAAFVDFAHSSDGMEKVLSTIKPLVSGRLIVVWGAGGDRSREKRPVVGAIMAEYADLSIVTTDNPRSEDPGVIAADVKAGIVSSGFPSDHRVILDRREAIFNALDSSKNEDVVVIAGKGPERTIEFADRTLPFCDNEVLLDWAFERSVEVLQR